MKKIYLIALVLAIITGFAVFSFGRSLEAKATPEQVPMTSVVVTTMEIDQGVYISAEMVQLQAVPTAYVASGVATALEDVVGKVNKYRAMANQQVMLDQLGSAEDAAITAGGRLSYTVTPGMRAMTIYVTEITGVAGYLNPGDRVDIIGTYDFLIKPEGEEGGEGGGSAGGDDEEIQVSSANMFLENIKILETGIITQKLTEAAGGELSVYTSLTVEVSPEDALKLQFVTAYGNISLLLRAASDEENVNPAPYSNFHIQLGILDGIAGAGLEVK